MSSNTIFNLESVSRAKKGTGNKIIERDILSLFEKDGVKMVKYIVKNHPQKHRINSIKIVKRKSFIDWLDGVQLEKDSFKENDLIEFGEFVFQVLKNKGVCGDVLCTTSKQVLKDFYWSGCSDEISYKIGQVTI